MIPQGLEIYVATSPVDLRYGMERLGGLVREHVGRDPRSKALFVFINKRRQAMKVLSWDGTGMVLWYKKLDRGNFDIPKPSHEGQWSVSISETVFDALFAGLPTKTYQLH